MNILSNNVTNIQKMVDYEKKTIFTNYIGAYSESNISLLSPLNPGLVNGSSAGTSTIGTLSTFISCVDASGTATAINMNVNGRPILDFSGSGNGIVYDSKSIATEFRVSSMTFAADLAIVSTMMVGGTCFAQSFVTLSDSREKQGIRIFDTDRISQVNPYSFHYRGSEEREIGLLAQELEGILPECVTDHDGVKFVKYDSVVALLVGAVKKLEGRIEKLELGV